MGKKKPFIRKSEASTYKLVHRSQRDVADEEGGGGMVLWPTSDRNDPHTDQKVLLSHNGDQLSAWREKLAQAGLLDEGVEQYMKPITGTGTFLDATGHVGSSQWGDRARPIEEETLVEVNRQLDSIPVTASCMDEEIAEALFGDFDEGDFEELNDEFVLDAAQEPPEGSSDGFDFDEHVRKLMAKARLERSGGVATDQMKLRAREEGDFFSGMRPLHEEEDSWDEDHSFQGTSVAITPGVVAALNPEEERALCQKFEETLAEYDTEDEEYDDFDQEGQIPLEGNQQLENVLDDFLLEDRDQIFMQGSEKVRDTQGGSGFSVLVGKQMVKDDDQLDAALVGPTQTVDEVMQEAKDFLARPIEAVPPEEVLIDGKSYFSERERNPWDCESILTTYSNLDNNPVVIQSSGRRRKKKGNNEDTADDGIIRLSSKTGLPVGVFGSPPEEVDDDDLDSTLPRENEGKARDKTESKDSKKLRKQAAKQQKQLARLRKKITREAFQDEFQKQSADLIADDIAGRSVFRYS